MDQIQFMHDQGFRSLEDNGMKNRSKNAKRYRKENGKARNDYGCLCWA